MCKEHQDNSQLVILRAKTSCNIKANYLKGMASPRVNEQNQCSQQLQVFRSSDGGTTLPDSKLKLVKARKEQLCP